MYLPGHDKRSTFNHHICSIEVSVALHKIISNCSGDNELCLPTTSMSKNLYSISSYNENYWIVKGLDVDPGIFFFTLIVIHFIGLQLRQDNVRHIVQCLYTHYTQRHFPHSSNLTRTNHWRERRNTMPLTTHRVNGDEKVFDSVFNRNTSFSLYLRLRHRYRRLYRLEKRELAYGTRFHFHTCLYDNSNWLWAIK